MATRHLLFKRFGPQLIEAIVTLLFREINLLRQQAGLQQRTVQQALDALESEMNNTSKYDWQKE